MTHAILIRPYCFHRHNILPANNHAKLYKLTISGIHTARNYRGSCTLRAVLTRKHQEIRVFMQNNGSMESFPGFFTNFHHSRYLFKAHFYDGCAPKRWLGLNVFPRPRLLTFVYEIKNHNSDQNSIKGFFYRFHI